MKDSFVPPWKPALHQVAAWLAIAPKAALLELMARIGFIARGVVYLSVGTLALLAVLDVTPRASGVVEAMAAWGRWPSGVALIWLTAMGLAAFAAWRALQALFDADGHGRTPKAIGVRIGQAISGVAHGALSWSLAGLLDGLDDLHEGDSAQAAASAALALPFGDLLLIGAGGLILAFGIGSMIQGAFQSFSKRLGCSSRVCRWIVPLARTGYVGRGLAFAPVGFFLLLAGLTARAAHARDFAGAFQALEAQPFGSAVLAAAAGLLCFGLFAFCEAAYRRIDLTRTPSPDGHETTPSALEPA